MSAHDHLNRVQFYHGTTAELGQGDTIEPGHPENYPVDEKTYPNPGSDVYFTSNQRMAQGYADRASGKRGGYPKVYEVEPTGDYEPHPPDSTHGYRSGSPLRVLRKLPEDD